MSIKKLIRKNKFIHRTYLKYKLSKIQKYCEKNELMTLSEKKKSIENRYYSVFKEDIDWENPEKYTEKMQWKKLFYKDERWTAYSDKVLVRDYVKKVIGEEYLIPLLGVWKSFDMIDFETLPKSFVLKTNHGTGTNIIVKDKDKLDKKIAKVSVDNWLKIDFGYRNSFEMHYSAIDKKVFAEKNINTVGETLQDYKFLCFDGKAHYVWIDVDRYGEHRRNVYDMNWELQSWGQKKLGSEKDISRPENFELMISLAEKLSSNFSHVRVDLYNTNGKIYFGELTFTNGSGFDVIYPREYDYHLGKLWGNYRNS